MCWVLKDEKNYAKGIHSPGNRINKSIEAEINVTGGSMMEGNANGLTWKTQAIPTPCRELVGDGICLGT